MNAWTAIIAGGFVVLVLVVVALALARAARVGDEIAASCPVDMSPDAAAAIAVLIIADAELRGTLPNHGPQYGGQENRAG